MTIQILSDSETARKSYAKEIDQFLENGLVGANIPQGSPYRTSRAENRNLTAANADTSHIHSSYTNSQAGYNTVTDDQEERYD